MKQHETESQTQRLSGYMRKLWPVMVRKMRSSTIGTMPLLQWARIFIEAIDQIRQYNCNNVESGNTSAMKQKTKFILETIAATIGGVLVFIIAGAWLILLDAIIN